MEEDSQQKDVIEDVGSRVPVGLVFITISGLVLALALGLIPVWLEDFDRSAGPNVWQEIIGDFHPMLLHMPIGVFSLIFAMEVLGWLSFGKWRPQTTFPLLVGVLSAAVAVIAGNFLHLQGTNSDASISNHLWGSTVFAIIAIMSYLTKIWSNQNPAKSPIYPILLVVTMGTMCFATHAGGGLVWGDPFQKPISILIGDKKDDDAGKQVKKAASAKPVADRLVYKEVVVPLLRSKCYECHSDADQNPSGKKKIKGKLVMTSIESMKKGGDEYHAIVAGDVEDSLMIERIKLPKDEDEHMPPEDKPQIESHELQILEWWIKSDLPEGKTMKEAGAPAEIMKAAGMLKSEDEIKQERAARAAEETARVEAAAAQRKAIEGAMAVVSKDFPNALGFVSQQDSDLTFTAVSMRKEFKDEHLAKLTPVGGGLVDLNLGSTSVTDGGTAVLSKMPKLRKLWLNGTKITDTGLDAVSALAELEYLNLYGTEVTNEGLKKLAGLKNLKNLYLWQTKVTPEAVEEFKKARPDCDVNLGIATN